VLPLSTPCLMSAITSTFAMILFPHMNAVSVQSLMIF
jgi:hypothetical protein